MATHAEFSPSWRYGGFWLRGNALFLDSVVLLPVWIAMQFIDNPMICQLFGFAAPGVYYMWFVASPWQATPGKRWLGIYIIRADGEKMTAFDALKRYTAYFIPTLPLMAIPFVAPQVPLTGVTLMTLADQNALLHVVQQAAEYSRVAVPLLLVSLAMSGVWFLPAAFSKEKKALHDRLCSTRVVYGKPEEGKEVS